MLGSPRFLSHAEEPMAELTHVDAEGNATMVEVGDKAVTDREAIAEGFIQLTAEGMRQTLSRSNKKGDVLTIAQLAGIQAAKRTSDLIPLCHPLVLTGVKVWVTPHENTLRVHVRARVRTTGQTGVEMEALTSVSAALLTVYDMLKAVDKGMVLGPIQLVEKRGGRSGHWVRS